MSTSQRNRTLLIDVSPYVGDVLRTQTLLVLEFTHHLYEDISSFCPESQYALSVIYRDAFAVIDALGWQRPDEPPERVEVPLTAGHIEQLRHRRYDLGMTNIDRLPENKGPISRRSSRRSPSTVALPGCWTGSSSGSTRATRRRTTRPRRPAGAEAS